MEGFGDHGKVTLEGLCAFFWVQCTQEEGGEEEARKDLERWGWDSISLSRKQTDEEEKNANKDDGTRVIVAA